MSPRHQTDITPKPLPLRPWLPGDLAQEVQQFNGAVGALRAAAAAEPGELDVLRAAVLEDSVDFGAIAAQRQAQEFAHLALQAECRRLHRTRPDLARRCAEAGRQVAAQAAQAAADHAASLRVKAQDFNLSRDLVEEVVKADPQQQALDQAAAALKYEATMYAVQQAPDNAALRAIADALSLWACGEVVPPMADANEDAPPRSGMMCETPVGGTPAPVPEPRSEAQRLCDAGIGAFTRMGDGRLAADVVAAEAVEVAEVAPESPADDAPDGASVDDDLTAYDEHAYPVLEDLADVPLDDPDAAALLPQGDGDGADADADGFDAEEGETADVLQ